MDLGLSGKIALVTGSSKGIGLAIAQALAAEGAKVYVNGRTQEAVDKALAQIPSKTAEGIVADLATADGAEKTLSKLPSVDILVNNMGIYEPKEFTKITDEDWTRFFETNVMSGVRLCRAYLPKMITKNEGRIVFISSESAINIPAEMIHYGFTKTAQLAIARGLAETTAGTNVTVNSVLPGPTMSEGVQDFVTSLAKEKNISKEAVEEDFFKTVRPSSLIKRFASCEEVASMVAYVCSDKSSATNGAALRVEGGCVRSIL